MMYDFLIVGQGIAGTVLCHKLTTLGKSVHVIDNQHKTSSTKIAAGIVNPITGRKFIKSWKIDDLIPSALSCYAQLEEVLKIKLVEKANIIRVVFNEESQRHWERIQLDESASKYIIDKPDLSQYNDILHPIHGAGELSRSFRVDMSSLISAYQLKLQKANQISFEDFDDNRVSFNESEITYKGLKAKKIIYCQGYKAIENSLFKYLPFQPAKGQAITFRLDDFKATKMLRHKEFIVPLGDHKFWSGGGYEWQNLNEVATDAFLENWKTNIKQMIKPNPMVIDHQAAVRPSVKGRRPLLGNHPRYKNAYIFNGMGTKGASLVPYWADHFIDHLENGIQLDELVDIKRFAT